MELRGVGKAALAQFSAVTRGSAALAAENWEKGRLGRTPDLVFAGERNGSACELGSGGPETKSGERGK